MSNWGNVEHFGPAFNFVLCISILEGDGGKKGGTETQRVVGTREQSVRRVAFPKGVGVIKMQQRAGMVHQFSAETNGECDYAEHAARNGGSRNRDPLVFRRHRIALVLDRWLK
jgi:hypothetical protein